MAWPRSIHGLSLTVVCVAAMLAGCAAYETRPMESETTDVDAPTPMPPVEGIPLDGERVDLLDRLDSAIHLVGLLDYDGAAKRLAPLAAEFEDAGDEANTAKALFWLGYCHEKRQRLSVARGTYRRVIEQYGGQPAGEQARRRLAWLDELSATTGS
ncbi:MAG: tetratricopeptide repeat protein [Planctomycetota bacterium]|jgi:hypothetical protein